MNTYIVYLRFRGHIERKYESACNEFEATAQALRYFRGGRISSVVCIR